MRREGTPLGRDGALDCARGHRPRVRESADLLVDLDCLQSGGQLLRAASRRRSLTTAVAMEVVVLTQTVQQTLRRAEVRRHFGFALWELHQEMSQHLETLDDRLTLVQQGVTGEPSRDGLRTWASSVDAFPDDSWDRFLTIGGLHRLLDSAPDQVAWNLYRYYDGVRTFNNEAALRDRMLERLFTVTGPATAGIFQSVKSSDKRLESWLSEVP